MIKGVWTALPNLDYFGHSKAVLEVVSDRLFKEGIQGILALGTTGQGADKSLRQRMNELEMLATCCPPDKMIVGVTANAVQDVRMLIDHAASCGIRGVAVTAPYYGTYSEEELHRWLEQTLENGPASIEYYMYNIPGSMHHNWSTSALDVAAGLVSVSGIKDSSGDMTQLLSYLTYARNKSYSVMVGDERFGVYSLLMGGQGFVSGFSSAFPRLMCDLYDACVSSRVDDAIRLQQQVNDRVSQLLRYPSRKMVGVLVDWMRENDIVPSYI